MNQVSTNQNLSPANNEPLPVQKIVQTKPQITNPVDAIKKGMELIDVLAPNSIEIDFNHIK